MTPDSVSATSLDDLLRGLRSIVRQEVQAALPAAIRDLPGSRPEWTSLARYARSCGLGASTVRRWARAAGLRRGPAGRYRTAELEEVVRRGGKPPPSTPPVDLATARARRAIEGLTTKGGRR